VTLPSYVWNGLVERVRRVNMGDTAEAEGILIALGFREADYAIKPIIRVVTLDGEGVAQTDFGGFIEVRYDPAVVSE
jgi:hypothetical protein